MVATFDSMTKKGSGGAFSAPTTLFNYPRTSFSFTAASSINSVAIE